MNSLIVLKTKNNIFIILMIFVILFFSIFPVKKLYYINHYNVDTSFEEFIENDSVIEDEFEAPANSEGIAILIGTYMKTLEKGILNMRIIDEQKNEEIYNNIMPFSRIKDCNFLNLKCKIEKNHKYRIIINIDNVDSNNNIVFSIAKTGNENDTYKINDIAKNHNLNISYIKESNSYENIWMIVFDFILIYFLIKDKKEQ